MLSMSTVCAQVYKAINTSFEANMSKIYKVQPTTLARSLVFKEFTQEMLEEICTKMEPVCFAENTTLLQRGSAGTCLYFISKGRCEQICEGDEKRRYPPKILGAGDMFGVRAVLLVEPEYYTVRSLNTIQAWV